MEVFSEPFAKVLRPSDANEIQYLPYAEMANCS